MGNEKRTIGKIENTNGDRYEGELLNGIPDGEGTMFFKTGTYTGGFSSGKFDGYGEMHMYPVPGINDFLFDNGEYIEGSLIKGIWKQGKKNGRFKAYSTGLPYDIEFDEDKILPDKLYYDIELPKESIIPGTIRCVYGGQSSFMIETEKAYFLFDWYLTSIPKMSKDKPIYVFISHIHMDHFNHAIFDMADNYDNIHFYMGLDIEENEKEYFESKFEDMFKKVDDIIEYFVGDEVLDTEFGEVTTLTSTDLGVAFLIKMDNLTLFHAGDLSWLSLVGSIKKFKKDKQERNSDIYFFSNSDIEIKSMYEDINEIGRNRFINYISYLTNVEIDYAMLPLDPRFGSFGIYTVEKYFETAKIRCFTPMHMWEQYSFASSFAKNHPRIAERMISVNPDGEKMSQTIELNQAYTIKLSDYNN